MRDNAIKVHADIFQELEDLWAQGDPRERKFTSEQDAAIWHARVTMEPPLSYTQFKRWWADRWGPVNDGTIRKRLDKLKAQGGPQ